MSEIDFRECKYISCYMKFYTYSEFCEIKEIARSRYNELSTDGKQFYKWYIYANPHLGLTFKDAIWDYLNGYDNGCNLMLLRRKYHKL